MTEAQTPEPGFAYPPRPRPEVDIYGPPLNAEEPTLQMLSAFENQSTWVSKGRYFESENPGPDRKRSAIEQSDWLDDAITKAETRLVGLRTYKQLRYERMIGEINKSKTGFWQRMLDALSVTRPEEK